MKRRFIQGHPADAGCPFLLTHSAPLRVNPEQALVFRQEKPKG